MDIVPARIVAPQLAPGRIEHHDAAGVGYGDAIARLALGKAPDLRADIAALQRAHALRETSVVHAPRQQIVGSQFGQDVGGIGQCVLHRLADARLDLLYEHPSQQQRRQRHDDEIPEQDPQADLHRQSTSIE